jgi:hypothetical protein
LRYFTFPRRRVALLNLELSFGDANTLKAVFQRALQHNDPKTIHKQMVRCRSVVLVAVVVVVRCVNRVASAAPLRTDLNLPEQRQDAGGTGAHSDCREEVHGRKEGAVLLAVSPL